MSEDQIYRLLAETQGQLQGLKTALAMTIASNRTMRDVMLANLSETLESYKSDPRNWETDMDKLVSPGFVNMLENIVAMLEEAQEAAP